LNFHQFKRISPKRIINLQKFTTKDKTQNNVEGGEEGGGGGINKGFFLKNK